MKKLLLVASSITVFVTIVSSSQSSDIAQTVPPSPLSVDDSSLMVQTVPPSPLSPETLG